MRSQAKPCGVLVVFDDQIHAARNVYKTNTTRLDAFLSVDRGPIGAVDTGKVTIFGCKRSGLHPSCETR